MMMKNLARMIVVAGLLLAASTAHARDTFNCVGVAPAIVNGNVVVPNGATCTMTGTRVRGDVNVEPGASLHAQTVQISGNVLGHDHRALSIDVTSRIDGNVVFEHGVTSMIGDSFVGQNLVFEEASSASKVLHHPSRLPTSSAA